MPIWPNIKQDQADLPAAALGSYKKEQDKLTDALRREALQAYYASISFMDAQVGHVVDALDVNGLAENTIIVFTSDHGYHTGEHGLWQKQSLFEESARVPLLIVAPNLSQSGIVSNAPVSQVDLFPTLAALCNIQTPENIQGQSLVPMLSDPNEKGRGWALTQVVRRKGKGESFFGYSLRTPRWRFTEWDEGRQGCELYDHDSDPEEITNLAEFKEHASTVAKLSEVLHHAISTTMPASGKTPEVDGSLWIPLLVP
jgi:iduronate 2-sulfatase